MPAVRSASGPQLGGALSYVHVPMASHAASCDFTMCGRYGASSLQETGEADMAQPHVTMLALTQANMRLALKLAETWRESELGRAPCRERVCQDGEIPVGAVSLK